MHVVISSRDMKNKAQRSGSFGAKHMLALYENMLLIRRFEESASVLYQKGEIAGFCHLYIGQEAIVTGIQELLFEEDVVITAYRDHGHMIACGMDPKGVMAELTGRIGGFSKGKGGSMHMFSKEKGFYGGHGIVGTTAPLGSGLAFAQKYLNTGGICVTYIGDGAMNQGQVYEAFNMASLWKLPVLFVIEDNGYAIGTAKERSTAGGDLYKRAEPFGIPGKMGDGMDINSVLELASWGLEHVRSQKGPAILQLSTYRHKGHSMSDATRLYRTKEEEQDVLENRDCLKILKKRLSSQGVVEKDFEAMEDKIKDIVKAACEFALNSPEPGEDELFKDVLV